MTRPVVRPARTIARGTASGRGFTLVELLVVIGIIVILMSILLPAAGKARVQAQGVRSAGSMKSLSEAIERYHSDHKAYPGVVGNKAVADGYTAPGLTGNLTMTENMVLALCGGFVYNDADPSKPGVRLADIGSGPLNLSAAPTRRKRQPAYVEPGGLFPPRYSPGDAASGAVNGATNPLELPGQPVAADSNVPEFVDAYGQPRVIVYLRAVVGGAVLPDPPPGQMSTKDYYRDDTLQYDLRHITPYRRSAALGTNGKNTRGDFGGDFSFSVNETDPKDVDMTEFQSAFDYMRHPTLPNTPRGKDKYLLISAGPDRRYGTKDDIVVGG